MGGGNNKLLQSVIQDDSFLFYSNDEEDLTPMNVSPAAENLSIQEDLPIQAYNNLHTNSHGNMINYINENSDMNSSHYGQLVPGTKTSSSKSKMSYKADPQNVISTDQHQAHLYAPL